MSDFILGQHEAAIRELLDRTERIEAGMTSIQQTLAEQRGEKRVALYVAGAVGALVMSVLAFAVKLIGSVIHSRLAG